ncbi:MAG: hypothetical protein LBJ33_22460 [Pseudomonas putida]|jgi:hypothetical protein|nr:hypothetical protein [Pseudomonas putida]
MLGLTLREEFRGKRLESTAIELSNDQNTGATQIAKQLLEITYPTHDLLKGIEAIGPNQGCPVAVIGERGLGNAASRSVSIHNSWQASQRPLPTQASLFDDEWEYEQ